MGSKIESWNGSKIPFGNRSGVFVGKGGGGVKVGKNVGVAIREDVAVGSKVVVGVIVGST
jgi:hypothetical protein